MIKIISGIHKNKSIKTPKSHNTRPTSIRLRETIFNIISHSKKLNIQIDNANVLDLFAGSGAFGLECLSRGAKNCIFIDNNIEAIHTIINNIKTLKEGDNSTVIKHDATKPFQLNQNVDLCFIDPPYEINNIFVILKNWVNSGYINKKAIYILEKKSINNLIIPKNIKIIDSRKQGISEVIFFKTLCSSK